VVEVGFSNEIVIASVSVLLFGSLITCRSLSLFPSLLIATLKVSIPLFFFSWLDEKQYQYLDDVKYVAKALSLRDGGYTAWNTLIGTAPSSLRLAIQGDHVLYYWWNLLAFHLFGTHYWSAIFLNVGLTFVAALAGGKVWMSLGLTKHHTKYIVAFLLLHWDVLMWSSLINLKDTIVATITLIAFWNGIEVLERRRGFHLLSLFICLLLLSKIRHYVPPIFVGCMALTFGIKTRGWLPLFGAALSFLGVIVLRPWESNELGSFNFSNLPFKCIRFVLMPYFWQIESSLDFMEVPQFFHWVAFPLAVFGAWRLIREYPASHFLFIYFSAMVLFYASVPMLQGPRQRFQLVGIFALCQFYGASVLLWGRRTMSSSSATSPSPSSVFT
jgi:hypothetical protein